MNIEFSKRYPSIWDAHKIMIVLIRSRIIITSLDLEVAKRLLSPGELNLKIPKHAGNNGNNGRN